MEDRTQYSQVPDHNEDESRPLVVESSKEAGGNDNGNEILASMENTILPSAPDDDSNLMSFLANASYQRSALITDPRTPSNFTVTTVDTSNGNGNGNGGSSHSIQHPLRERKEWSPERSDLMMKKKSKSTTPKTNNRKSISSTRSTVTSSLIASSNNNIQPAKSSKNKNPKSFVSHLSYIMTDDDDDESLNGTTPARVELTPHNGVIKRGLLLLTLAFVLGTILSRNYHGYNYQPPNNNGTNTQGAPVCVEQALTNAQAISALQNVTSVTNVTNGAVASDNKICSEMGVSIMRDFNGNAVDAAVTTTLCLGLANPASSGIGGGAFILIHSAPRDDGDDSSQPQRSTPFIDRRRSPPAQGSGSAPDAADRSQKNAEVVDCRETAPGDATYDMFESLPPSSSVNGALSIAVPGELRGLELAHSRYGRLSWEQVLQPVVDLAERGVPVSMLLAKEIQDTMGLFDQFEAIKRILTINNDGRTYLVEGDLMTRPQYTETLKNIAIYGADYVYRGEVAAQIAQEIQAGGGIITKEDIENYKPILRDPLIAQVDGISIVSVPPPSSGGATIIGALRFLSGYDNPFATFAETLSKHRLVEAFKHVFAMRMSLSDPDYFTNVTEAAVRDLVTGTFMEELRRITLDNGVLPLSAYGGKWALVNDTEGNGVAKDAHEGDRRLERGSQQKHRRTRLFNYLEDHGTTHIAVVDKDRNSVSITSSVNYYFGSKFASPSTGIIFNDVMDDFATPGRPNVFGKFQWNVRW